MTINEYKAALKNMIDSTDDEAILKGWKTYMEPEFEQYQRTSAAGAKTGQKANKDNDEGYVVLESGLGINE